MEGFTRRKFVKAVALSGAGAAVWPYPAFCQKEGKIQTRYIAAKKG